MRGEVQQRTVDKSITTEAPFPAECCPRSETGDLVFLLVLVGVEATEANPARLLVPLHTRLYEHLSNHNNDNHNDDNNVAIVV